MYQVARAPTGRVIDAGASLRACGVCTPHAAVGGLTGLPDYTCMPLLPVYVCIYLSAGSMRDRVGAPDEQRVRRGPDAAVRAVQGRQGGQVPGAQAQARYGQ